MPIEKSAVELRDTVIAGTVEVGTQVFVFLRAYVHRSEGRPGYGVGTYWEQAAILAFTEASIECEEPYFPASIWEGKVTVDEQTWENVLPLPFQLTGAVVFDAYLDVPTQVRITATEVELVLMGEAVYLEDFLR